MRRLGFLLLVLVPACHVPGPEHRVPPEQSTWVPAENDAIVVAGRRFHVGAPVVLWTDPPNYDAYSTRPRFAQAGDPDVADELRYQPGRVRRVLRENPDYVPKPVDGPDERTDREKQKTVVER